LRLFTHDLHDEFTGSHASVKIDENDLLPGAKRESPLYKGNREGWPLQLPAQMGMPIVFSRIFGVVFPIGSRRDSAIPKVFCVGSNAWFVFDDHDAGGGVFNKQR